MSEQAKLNNVEVIYLGGTRPPTDFQILQAASGKPVQDPEILGQGPIRGTREEFRSHIKQVVEDLDAPDIQPSNLQKSLKTHGNAFYLSAKRERKMALGATLLESLAASDRTEILREVGQDLRHSYSLQSHLHEIEARVAAKENR